MPLITAAEIATFAKQDPSVAEVLAEFTLLYSIAVADIETALGRAIDGSTHSHTASSGYPTITSLRRDTTDSSGVSTVTTVRGSLSDMTDYATRFMALASGWILDVVVDRWKHRVASVSSESGTGGSVTYETGWLPPRVAQSIRAVQRELADQ